MKEINLAKEDYIFDLSITCIVGIIFGAVLSWTTTKNTMKQKAVEAGVAEYYLDEENNKEFRYLSPLIETEIAK